MVLMPMSMFLFFDTVRQMCIPFDYVVPLSYTMFAVSDIVRVVGHVDGDVVLFRVSCGNLVSIIRSYESHYALVQSKDCSQCSASFVQGQIKYGVSDSILPSASFPVPAYEPDYCRGPQYIVPMLPCDVDPPREPSNQFTERHVRRLNEWDIYDTVSEDESEGDVGHDDEPFDYGLRMPGNLDEEDLQDPWEFLADDSEDEIELDDSYHLDALFYDDDA